MKRFAIVLTLLTAFALPVLVSPSQAPAATDKPSDTYKLLDLFGTIFERVRSSYVDKVDDKKLIEAAINGMLRSLDPHSSYMNAEVFKEMQVQTRGKFGGLGIEVTMDKGYVKVVAPIDDTPAARAGVQPGDLITHINGKTVQGMSLRDAVKLMRGDVGSKITITIRREGRPPFDITITRAVITVKSVRYKTYDNVGYVRITSFTEQTDIGLKRALEAIKEKLGKKWIGTVVDLRNNPGGLLDQSVNVADAFLERGEIVSTRGRDKKIDSRFSATAGDLTGGRPIVVLINGGSASASEIVAGALQDHRRAIIMGTQSFGKGSVQSIIPLAGQGALRLTTARYYTPSGVSIQAKGITPNIVVEQGTLKKATTGPRTRERDLRGALDTKKDDAKKEADKKGADKKDPAKPDAKKDEKAGDKAAGKKAAAKPVSETDYQLSRAIDLLRGIALYDSNRKGK
jgi:carboxyl-terminal processing protease